MTDDTERTDDTATARIAALLGDARVAEARQAEWWTNDEDHHLLIRVLRAECEPWAAVLVEAGVGFVAQAKAEERERIATLLDTTIPVTHDGYASVEELVDAIRAAREDGAKS